VGPPRGLDGLRPVAKWIANTPASLQKSLANTSLEPRNEAEDVMVYVALSLSAQEMCLAVAHFALNWLIAAKESGQGERHPYLLCEMMNPLGNLLVCSLGGDVSGFASLPHSELLFAEVATLCSWLQSRLQISPHTLARAISLIEKAVEQQDRVVLRPSTVRPLLVTATLLACKDHYDNDVEWSVRRFQEALPELELGHLVDMEVNLLQALDFRVAYWNKHEWACCCCALASRLQESHQEFRAFKRSFNAMYNCRAHGNSAAASVCAKQASSSPRMRRRCREHHSSSHSSKTKSC